MAESPQESSLNSDNANWFGSWFAAAKNKSCEVLEFVKKDLEEFGTAVKSEATNVVSNTGNAIEKTLKLDEPESTVNNMKRSISSFLGQMNEILNPSPDDSDTEAILIVDGQEAVQLTKIQKAIYELQKSEKTFLEDPDASLTQQYQSWLEIIDDQLCEERLSKHLLKSQMLQNHYTSLVPIQVEHFVFWKRYLFKKALLEDEICRLEAVEKRETREKQNTIESVNWEEATKVDDVAEEFAKDIEISEQEQIRLLEEYENETKVRRMSSGCPTTKALVANDNKSTLNNNNKTVKDEETQDRNEKTSKSPNAELEQETCKIASSDSSTDGDWEKISD